MLLRLAQWLSLVALCALFSRLLPPLVTPPVWQLPLVALLLLMGLTMRLTWSGIEWAGRQWWRAGDRLKEKEIDHFSALLDEHAHGDLSRRAVGPLPGMLAGLAERYNEIIDRYERSMEELHEHRCELLESRARIEEQTAEIQLKAEQLRVAHMAADQANQAKSAFLANMSHEIRTPMTAVLGFAEMLLDEEDDARLSPSQRDAVATIHRNGRHLLQLINDILDLSKIEAGRITVERIDCDPCQVVDDALAMLRARASAKGLTLEVDQQGPLPERICTDPTRLRQILVNLLGNAVKFTEHGGVQVELRLNESDAGQPLLEVEVHDSGIGISPDKIHSIFQPFMQADVSTTRKYGGSGLGLAISRSLAEHLGGELTAVSEPGAGSTFRLTVQTGPLEGVPRRESNAMSGDGEQRSLAASEAQWLAGSRILVADDSPDVRRLVEHVLNRAGAHVEVAEDGLAAVERILHAQQSGRAYDVVLMDMQMPQLDGYAATRRLRQEGYCGRIIALTARAMQGDREACLDAGCDDYSSKPIRRRELIALVQRYLLHQAS